MGAGILVTTGVSTISISSTTPQAELKLSPYPKQPSMKFLLATVHPAIQCLPHQGLGRVAVFACEGGGWLKEGIVTRIAGWLGLVQAPGRRCRVVLTPSQEQLTTSPAPAPEIQGGVVF